MAAAYTQPPPLFRLDRQSTLYLLLKQMSGIQTTVGVHTVFILAENILYLEEWLVHHVQLGVSKFYLYDNSKVTTKSPFDQPNPHLVPGQVSKYGVHFRDLVTDTEVNTRFQDLLERYPQIVYTDWSPMDDHGNILYDQEGAHAHCLERLKHEGGIDWCANIDMDEFIIPFDHDTIPDFIDRLPMDVSNIHMAHRVFRSRFETPPGETILSTRHGLAAPVVKGGRKNLYRVQTTATLSVHDWIGTGLNHTPAVNSFSFNHYKWCHRWGVLDTHLEPRRALQFSHITQNGGTAIEDAAQAHEFSMGRFSPLWKLLAGGNGLFWHRPIRDLDVAVQRRYDWFMVVRDPYTRMISEFYALNPSAVTESCTTEVFNQTVSRGIRSWQNLHNYGHYRPQAQYRPTEDGVVMHILRFEDLNHSFNRLMESYGLPMRLHGTRVPTERRFTVSDFSEATIQLINDVYHQSFDDFNYARM